MSQTSTSHPSGPTARFADPGYRQLGASGLTVSVVGLGCNNFGGRIDAAATDAVVGTALDAGITLFDTADIYGGTPGQSEELLGAPSAAAATRSVVATKFGMDMHGVNGPDWGVRGSRRYIRTAVEASLRRLGTDWIDLYQIHRPDPLTPIEETLRRCTSSSSRARCATSAARTSPAGRSSTPTGRRAPRASPRSSRRRTSTPCSSARSRPTSCRRCEHVGVGLLPYFPLASGLLTGKYRRGDAAPRGHPAGLAARAPRDADFDRVEALERFAQERGVSMLDVAIGGLAAQPAVGSVIAGATTPEQVRANAAAGRWEPAADDLADLDDALAGGDARP